MEGNKVIRVVGFGSVVLVLLIGCWFMLTSCSRDRGNGDNIEDGLDQTEAELQRATESNRNALEGIARSEDSVGRIESSVGRSEELIGDLTDDLRRNDAEVDAALGRIEDAEIRNREAEERIADCESRINELLRISRESESIFARYENGN